MGTWAAAVQQGDAGTSWGAHMRLDADGAGQRGGTLGPPQAQQVRRRSQISQRRLQIGLYKTCVKLHPCMVWRCAGYWRHELAQGVPSTLRLTMGPGCTMMQ